MKISRSYTLCFSFYRLKPFLEIGDNIVNMLCTDGKTNSVLLNALILKLCIGELAVGCSRGMNHKTLDVRNVGKKREYLQASTG